MTVIAIANSGTRAKYTHGSIKTLIEAFTLQTKLMLDLKAKSTKLPAVKAVILPFKIISAQESLVEWPNHSQRITLISRHSRNGTNKNCQRFSVRAIYGNPNGEFLVTDEIDPWLPKLSVEEQCNVVLEHRLEPEVDSVYIAPLELGPRGGSVISDGMVESDATLAYGLKAWTAPTNKIALKL